MFFQKMGALIKGLLAWVFIGWVIYMFAFGGCAGNNSADKKDAWNEGGTLHSATIAEWKKATPQNKLATCADIVANLLKNDKLNFKFTGMDNLKTHAQELVDFIDTSTEGNDDDFVNTQDVSQVAAMGVIIMGWTK